ncbi:MAG TPA: type II toxin-antitoxin system RelE/ParE family toxin [Bryobacteraceae bacterium]|nr:type II toxin-antitoxin system RelE/ParE family toxin [Bryobacteraceae bacterium]
MSPSFQLSPQAVEDIDEIWWFISQDDLNAANRVEGEIVAACRSLALHPLMGIRRPDITSLPVRFWTLPRYPNYVIVYRPGTDPLQVIAVLHGRRDLARALKERK